VRIPLKNKHHWYWYKRGTTEWEPLMIYTDEMERTRVLHFLGDEPVPIEKTLKLIREGQLLGPYIPTVVDGKMIMEPVRD
jgi:hypothetical protein